MMGMQKCLELWKISINYVSFLRFYILNFDFSLLLEQKVVKGYEDLRMLLFQSRLSIILSPHFNFSYMFYKNL